MTILKGGVGRIGRSSRVGKQRAKASVKNREVSKERSEARRSRALEHKREGAERRMGLCLPPCRIRQICK